jgi:NAD-dependent SIR2 family protein deacetylase
MSGWDKGMGEPLRRELTRPAYLRELDVTAVVEVGDVEALAGLVGGAGVVVLSGAGLSTESGIPDYRGPRGALRRHTPMTYQEFTGDPHGRRRYWARSFLGWRHVAAAAPNQGHRVVAALEHAGYVAGVVTQNVDGLHQAAGTRRVVDLHGSLDRVVCLSCRATSARAELDDRLRAANPRFEAQAARAVAALGADGEVSPDGDVALPDAAVAGFVVLDCLACGSGRLKPDVVFFGETVPRRRVEECLALVDTASALLVLGSSLTVMSGFRFVLRAAARGIPVAIVNQGPTRGDGRAAVRLDAPLGRVLPDVARRLLPVRSSG